MIANEDASVTLVVTLENGLELTVHLKPDKPAELAREFENAAKALSR